MAVDPGKVINALIGDDPNYLLLYQDNPYFANTMRTIAGSFDHLIAAIANSCEKQKVAYGLAVKEAPGSTK